MLDILSCFQFEQDQQYLYVEDSYILGKTKHTLLNCVPQME